MAIVPSTSIPPHHLPHRLNIIIGNGNKRPTAPSSKEAQSKPYYSDYSPTRLLIHNMCTSQYLDLFITVVIGLNVITMAMEHYQQPKELDEALKICNYIFTLIFVLESVFKLVAFGLRRFFKDRWNQLDLAIVLLSIMGITLEEIEVNASLPINPTIIRIMRVLRIARVLKLLKMAVGMRALLDTVMQALPQVGNLGLLFMLLFFIFAALGVELFGDLICDELHPCEGLGRYATFKNFGMAFLLLFRVSTGDNWNGIMKDTLRDCQQENAGTCYNTVVSPIYFVSFVLTAQFVLVNVVIAVLMKHLEESNKEAKEEAELEAELQLELQHGGGGGSGRSPQLSPLDLGMEVGGPGVPPWRSPERIQRRASVMVDSPQADITPRDISSDPLLVLEPPLEGRSPTPQALGVGPGMRWRAEPASRRGAVGGDGDANDWLSIFTPRQADWYIEPEEPDSERCSPPVQRCRVFLPSSAMSLACSGYQSPAPRSEACTLVSELSPELPHLSQQLPLQSSSCLSSREEAPHLRPPSGFRKRPSSGSLRGCCKRVTEVTMRRTKTMVKWFSHRSATATDASLET
ncbi:voltage-dependent T-type calcium channel subunit alpha-1G-like [Oncorhynchus tshawytscha]|uniref:voltage-dependent T-type calcium channel subunit alpha-1G-like n=1 Tax=Oncorhynchus tshawytscha TaxID=74940 RepID=UPI001C3DFE1F|nr:voltage-dependent T-type calcium channel subunit alpha-1G-like [Oncorhynchus tshawytscha]